MKCLINVFGCCYFISIENSDDSKQQYFSSNTNDDGKSSSVKLHWIMLQNDVRGFPSCEQKKRPYQKHNVKMERGIQEAKNKRWRPGE